MPIRESHPAGAPVWADFNPTDLKAAHAFYGGLFGWTFEASDPKEYAGYANALLDGRRIAGFMPHMAEMGPGNVWSVYLKVDDIQAATRAVAEAGGKVQSPPMFVEPYGHMAIFEAPGGVSVGAWQPETHQGFGADSMHGAPAWFETVTPEYPASVAFYQRVFGWKTDVMSDTPEMGYTTLGKGGDARAGIMDASRDSQGTPHGWAVYWGARDVDAAAKKAVELGGKVVDPPKDTPYGRLAELRDSLGARLLLMSVPA